MKAIDLVETRTEKFQIRAKVGNDLHTITNSYDVLGHNKFETRMTPSQNRTVISKMQSFCWSQKDGELIDVEIINYKYFLGLYIKKAEITFIDAICNEGYAHYQISRWGDVKK
jgi:hypothetical protein